MKIRTAATAATALAMTVTTSPTGAATAGPADELRTEHLTAVAVTSLNRLVEVDVTDGRPSSSQPIRGLSLAESIVGIDYRPATGGLFGVARGLLGTTRIVRIDPDTARITFSRPLRAAGGSPIKLRGIGIGVDFNPAADRLRLTSTSGQNLRVDVGTGVAVVDGNLAYADGDVNEGRTPSVVASAYTNSDQLPSTDTELYGLDSARDTLVRQDPPNDGSLETVARIRGLNVTPSAGFDVSSDSDVGVVSVDGLLGSRLQVIDIDDGAPLLSRSVPLTRITDIALTPGR